MMRLEACVLQAEDEDGRGPGPRERTLRVHQRGPDRPAEMRPARTVLPVVEIVVAAGGLDPGRRDAVPFLVELLTVERPRLVNRIGMLVQDVRHPSRLVVPSEMQCSHPVREILEAHTGTVGIRYVVLQYDTPAVTEVFGPPQLSPALVTDNIELIAPSPVGPGMLPGHHPYIISESDRRGILAGNRPGPDGIMVQKESKTQPRPNIETESYPGPVNQRILHISDTQRFIISESPVQPYMAACPGYRHRLQRKEVSGHRAGIAALGHVSTRGGQRAEARVRAIEIQLPVLDPQVQRQRLPAQRPVQFVRHYMQRHRARIQVVGVPVPRQGRTPTELERPRVVELRPRLDHGHISLVLRHQAPLVRRRPERQRLANSSGEGPEEHQGKEKVVHLLAIVVHPGIILQVIPARDTVQPFLVVQIPAHGLLDTLLELQ